MESTLPKASTTRIALCITLSLFWGGPALAIDGDANPSPTQTTPWSRMEVFATKLFTTVKHLSEDVVPLVNAADEELARQWRSEWPHLQEEISRQLNQVLPGHKHTSDQHP